MYTRYQTAPSKAVVGVDRHIKTLQDCTSRHCRIATRQGKVREIEIFSRSGNFVNCQGNLEIQSNVRELSGNFEFLRFKSNF